MITGAYHYWYSCDVMCVSFCYVRVWSFTNPDRGKLIYFPRFTFNYCRDLTVCRVSQASTPLSHHPHPLFSNVTVVSMTPQPIFVFSTPSQHTHSISIVLSIIYVSLFPSIIITKLFVSAAPRATCSLKSDHIHSSRDLSHIALGSACSLSSGVFGIVSDRHSVCLSKTMASENFLFSFKRESKAMPEGRREFSGSVFFSSFKCVTIVAL